MNKYLVLGAGKMGMVLAKDLLESDPEGQVTLVDILSDRLNQAAEFISSDRLHLKQIDIEDSVQREKVFDGHDVVLCALLHRHSLMTLETALKKGIHFVDLIGEFTRERMEFDEEAKSKDVALLSGVGVSPGITNVCVGRGVHELDETKDALVYVGGNPVQAKPPLNYRIVYAVNSLLGLYDREVNILENGEEKVVTPLTGVESISFPPDFQEMECFYTDGLSSLFHTMQGKVKGRLFEKTVRFKGHSQEIQTLKSCGLFSKQPVQIGDQEVIPREVLETLLDERIKLGEEEDVTLLRVVISGVKAENPKKYVFEMIDYFDSGKNYSSMAKTTSFPASIAAQMIVKGTISLRGTLFPEFVFHGELFKTFIEELGKRGVTVTEKEEIED